ncbi:MAG: hypothetical protein ACRDXD_08265 [Acidimicrobiia bacterium]
MNERIILATTGWAVAVACGGGGASLATAPPETAAPTVSVAAPTTGGSGEECQAERPSARSEEWAVLGTADFSFSVPDWPVVPAGSDVPADLPFEQETLAEAGVGAEDRLEPIAFTGYPDTLPVVIVFGLEGVGSSLEPVYQRHEDRYRNAPDLDEMLRTGLRTCVGRVPAIGLELITQGAYQQAWFFLHDDTLYHLDFVAADPIEAPFLDEILRTWEWREG